MRPIFLEGEKIFLSPLSKDDSLENYVQWFNNQQTTLYMGSGRFPVTVENLRAYIDGFSDRKDGMLLGIFTKQNPKHIGNISLQHIDWQNRFGEIGVIIGDEESRNRGYAREAIKLIVKHAFDRINLRKIYAGIITGNNASKKAFEAVGFKSEGILREHFYLNDEYIDCLRMGLLKSEFRQEQG
jgi:[ribosomal protein S5]-alanine N-acetyltransferase